MSKVITIAEVRALAREYYNRGGDGVVECYEDYQILKEIEAGMTTKADWLNSFGVFDEVYKDRRNS